MRLVRLDRLPLGRSIELDARLTILLGAPGDVVGAIAELLREVVTGHPVTVDGTAELHGVIVGLRGRSFDVGGANWVDPVLDLARPAPLRLVGGSHRPAGDSVSFRTDGPTVEIISTEHPPDEQLGSEPTHEETRPSADVDAVVPPASGGPERAEHDPASTTRRTAADDLVRLRSELRSLDGERSVLAREAEQARGDLDSFARATLEVAVGQLEALGERVGTYEAEQQRRDVERAARRSELTSLLENLRGELASIPLDEADRVSDALDRLVALRATARRVDPRAAGLAVEIEELRRSTEALEERRLAVEARIVEAEGRLADARAEAEAARTSHLSPEMDPDLVRQLESVRDVIFDLEERGGRVAAIRSRRRIDELRSEEAMLLDQLGFDTYSDYVMGRPNQDTWSIRPTRRIPADERVQRLTDELEHLHRELADDVDEHRNRSERDRLIAEAGSILNAHVAGLSRLTTDELIDLLRTREEQTSPQASADRLAASAHLAAALVAAGLPSPGAAADPEAMEDLARRWLAEAPERIARAAEVTRSIEVTEQELERLDDSVRHPDDGGRSADLDAEIRAIRSRVADCEARVARHERATADLADLRVRELDMRDRERDLLVRISDRERLLSVLGEDVPPPSDRVASPDAPVQLPEPETAHTSTGTPGVVDEWSEESLRRLVDRDASVAVPVDDEWLLLARLGELRSLGRVGSVPLLLVGVDPSSTGAPALLHRVVSMSQLVQTIVVGDDEGLARWAAGLGTDATVIRW